MAIELANPLRTVGAIDVGASHIKSAILNEMGGIIEGTYEDYPTPRGRPKAFIQLLGDIGIRQGQMEPLDALMIGVNGEASMNGICCQTGPWYDIVDQAFCLAGVLGEREELNGLRLGVGNDVELAGFGAATLYPQEEAVAYVNIGSYGNAAMTRRTNVAAVTLQSQGYRGEFGDKPVSMPDGSRRKWGDLVSGANHGELYGEPGKSLADMLEGPKADEVLDQLARRVADMIGDLAAIFGPNVVVIGGGGSLCRPRFDPRLRTHLSQVAELYQSLGTVTKMPETVTFVPNEEVQTITLRGAAAAARARINDLVTVGTAA